jgi:hypothetical protein
MVVKWADTDEARAQRLAAKQGAPFGSPVQGGFPMGPNMGMGMGMGGGFSPMRPQGGPFSPQPMMAFSLHHQQQQQQQQQPPQQQVRHAEQGMPVPSSRIRLVVNESLVVLRCHCEIAGLTLRLFKTLF